MSVSDFLYLLGGFVIYGCGLLGYVFINLFNVTYNPPCSFFQFRHRLRALGVDKKKITYSLYRDFYYKFVDKSLTDVFDNCFDYWLSGPDGQNLLK